MNQTLSPKQITRLQKLISSLPAYDNTLNVTVLYEDSQSCKWSRTAFEKIERIAGKAPVRSTWWRVEDLHQPAVLAGAVSKAMQADLVLVALRATEGLPMPFYVWINSWLQHHRPGPSALFAVIQPTEPAGSASGRVLKYLQTVARHGRMDFLTCAPPATGPAHSPTRTRAYAVCAR